MKTLDKALRILDEDRLRVGEKIVYNGKAGKFLGYLGATAMSLLDIDASNPDDFMRVPKHAVKRA